MDESEVRQRILAAFAAVPRPAREEIVPHFCSECVELADDLAPHTATEIPDGTFQKHVRDMPLLSADAKHYYFPAWLIRGLDDGGPWLSDAASAVLYALLDLEHRWDTAQKYSREQWLVFQDWLSYVESIGDDIDGEQIAEARKRVGNEL
jgi:hypothetical protein